MLPEFPLVADEGSHILETIFGVLPRDCQKNPNFLGQCYSKNSEPGLLNLQLYKNYIFM